MVRAPAPKTVRPSDDPLRLLAGPGQAVDCPASLVETARAHARNFVDEASPVALSVTPAGRASGWSAFDPTALEPGAWKLDGDLLSYDIGPGAYAAETTLRLAWQVVAGRVGGLLLHASGVALDGRALIACGPSGAGKTTFARLAVEAGCTLLSDELLVLLPDGTVMGTPFYSEASMVGSPTVARAAGLLVLDKAPAEAWHDVAAIEALRVFLPQCFECEGLTPPRRELRRRLLAFAAQVPLKRLSFRRHPEAGHFVRSALAAARPGGE